MTMQDDSWAVLDFLGAYHADREQGEARTLAEYLGRFPGHEEAIAREWVLLHATDDADEEENRVGPYQLQRELGRGGQGQVWLAVDTRLGRRVALKLLREPGGEIRSNARFLREATLASKIEHPGICRVYEVGESDGTLWIAMEFVEGESLAQKLQSYHESDRKGPVPLPERGEDSSATRSASTLHRLPSPSLAERPVFDVLGLIEEIAQSLQAAHEQGVVHRDLKPANVIVTPRGRPVVLDFGLARDTEPDSANFTLTGAVFGTPSYMAPEQLDGREATASTDVWSLGVLLYELLLGERPFAAPNHQKLFERIRTEDPPALPRRLRGHSRDLRAVLGMALAKDPKRRYASAGDFAADLAALRRREPVQARLPGPMLRTVRWVDRNRVVGSLVCLVFVLLSFGLWRESAARREQEELRGVAETRSEQLRELVSRVLYDYQNSLRDVPGALHANQRIASETLRFLELLQSDGSRVAPADLVRARVLAAELLGDVERPHLGRLEEARALYEAALAGCSDIADASDRAFERARILGRLARLDLEGAELPRALERFDRACALLEDLETRRARREAAMLLVDRGRAMLRDRRGDDQEARAGEAIEQGLALFEELSAEQDAAEDPQLASGRAWALLLAAQIDAQQRRIERSGERMAAARAAFAALAERPFPGTSAVLGLARCEILEGQSLVAGKRAEEAERAFDRGLGRIRELLRVDPDNERARRAWIQACQERGFAWSRLGRREEAQRCYEEAIEVGEASRREGGLEAELVKTRLFLAELHYLAREWETAHRAFRTLQEKSARRHERDPGDLAALRSKVLAQLYAAKSLFRLDRSDEALAQMDEVLADYRELRAKLPSDSRVVSGTISALQTKGFALFGQRRFAEALATFEEALVLCDDGRLRTRGILRISIGNAQDELGRHREAVQSYGASREELDRVLRAQPKDFFALRNLAEATVLGTLLELKASEAGKGEEPDAARVLEALRYVDEATGGGEIRDSKLLLMQANLEVLGALLAGEDAETVRRRLQRAGEILERLPERERGNFVMRARYERMRAGRD